MPGETSHTLTENEPERAEEIKRAAQQQWSHDPAGSVAAGDAELGTPESFARVERYRYDEQPWMHDTFHYERFADQDVLEIGVGLGTDHLQFGRAGARLTGIDLTPRCIELTRQRLAQEGIESNLSVMDAERLTFPDDSFDCVYSFGVLHHTAAAEKAFAEVRRVLRPGGLFIGGLYNRNSAFIARVIAEYFLFGQWRTESFEDRLSRIEYSSGEDQAKPYVRLFTARELRQVLLGAGFSTVQVTRRHAGFGRHGVPEWLETAVGRTAGWYLVHEAS